ncbi:MAG: iron-containing alcohol dehydrogenase [Desulfitobacteriia bacterium]|jgi:alcohol dehydrogenase
MNFRFNIGPTVLFGEGISKTTGDIAKDMGAKNVFLLYDKGVKAAGIVVGVLKSLQDAGLNVTEFDGVEPNPSEASVEAAAEIGRAAKADVLVAIGGGSSMDTAKSVNVLLTNPAPINQYEGFGGKVNPTKPLILIPTTAGTGSEVTEVTVITSIKEKRKFIIGGDNIPATIALADPELTYGLPPSITASTGMDALTHAIESYLSTQNSIPCKVLTLKAAELIYKNLPIAYKEPQNKEARANMLLGSMMAAFGFTNTSLGVVHAFAHPFSAHLNMPHGLANAIALPVGIEFNAEVVPEQIKEVGVGMGLDVQDLSPEEASKVVVQALEDLCKELDIPTLSGAGVTEDQLPTLAQAAADELGTLATNPRPLSKEQALELLKKMF